MDDIENTGTVASGDNAAAETGTVALVDPNPAASATQLAETIASAVESRLASLEADFASFKASHASVIETVSDVAKTVEEHTGLLSKANAYLKNAMGI